MPTPDNSEKISNLQKYASRLFKEGELIEYRAKLADGSMRGFYFNDLRRYAEVVAMLDSDGRAQVSYVCINPLKGKLIRERGLTVNPTDEQVSQIISGPPGRTASNDDIDILRWIFIDVDTNRTPELFETDKKKFGEMQHEMATAEEQAASKKVAVAVKNYLREKGWPQPIVCSSGNGWHILFKMGLQNTAANVENHHDVLYVLKAKFDCAEARIDPNMYNAGRLTRAYGSTSRKGTDTPERPYRPNYMLDSTEPVGTVPLEQILSLIVDAPGQSGHKDDDLPELADGFEPMEWIEFYEKQGAWTIVGEKDWNGKPIVATDVCLFTRHKHSGAEFKSGFVVGDSFGYKCFSDDCEGKTIKDIFAYLRETMESDGITLKFKPWPKPIFKTESWEELVEEFGLKTVDEADRENEEAAAKQSVDAPVEPDIEGEPEIDKKRLKAPKVLDLAGWMISSILRDPVGVLPKFRQLKSHIESVIWVQLKAPVHEALYCILGYFEDTSLLPTKRELLNWMDESSHGVARKLREGHNTKHAEFSSIRDFIESLEDDPTKEFVPVVTELDRAAKLAAQKASTKLHYDTLLVKDEDVQAFRTAERQHAQKELLSKGEIVGKPLQEMAVVISQEFLKDVDGANDDGKFELGFPAIDEHSHIGLNGERCLFFYGPASVGKTTMLMTVAINAAARGKNGLIMIGEHQAVPMMKTLTLMAGHLVKDDPEIGALPGKHAWDGINRTATRDDWERINRLLGKIREVLPGWLGVENINAIAQNEDDRLGAVIDYVHSFNMSYPLDYTVIDPLDQVMPLRAMGRDDGWRDGQEVLQRIYNLSRSFEGRSGKGLMIFTSAQFTSKMQREIEKQQAKNATTMDAQDDTIISLMDQCSQVQYYTTIPQILDMGIGIVTRVKGGKEGYLVYGRSRFGSTFKYVKFTMDQVAHIITTTGTATYTAPMAAAATVGGTDAPTESTIEPFDEL